MHSQNVLRIIHLSLALSWRAFASRQRSLQFNRVVFLTLSSGAEEKRRGDDGDNGFFFNFFYFNYV
jgi:hypothetical protein